MPHADRTRRRLRESEYKFRLTPHLQLAIHGGDQNFAGELSCAEVGSCGMMWDSLESGVWLLVERTSPGLLLVINKSWVQSLDLRPSSQESMFQVSP